MDALSPALELTIAGLNENEGITNE
jgi:hypothetical protein